MVFVLASFAWMVLGGVMSTRSVSQSADVRNKVEGLWGQPQTQMAPALSFEWTPMRDVTHTEVVKGVEHTTTERVPMIETRKEDVTLAATRIDVDLHLDQRLKGLAWYSLYDVKFRGAWSYVHSSAEAGKLHLQFRFPDAQGVYDACTFVVDGAPQDLRPKDGVAEVTVPVVPGQRVEMVVAYKSRGLDSWGYVPSLGVGSLKDFALTMTTDFADIDFPGSSMSPSERARSDRGWNLVWRFDRIVTGHAIGMTMPTKVQPGVLAASLAFSAPISLGFFFVLLLVLGRLRGLDLHALNYLFVAGKKPPRRFAMPLSGWVETVRYSPDGRFLCTQCAPEEHDRWLRFLAVTDARDDSLVRLLKVPCIRTTTTRSPSGPTTASSPSGATPECCCTTCTPRSRRWTPT